MIITDLCVFTVGSAGGLTLSELHPGVTLDEVRGQNRLCIFAAGRNGVAPLPDLRRSERRHLGEDLEGSQTP